MTDPTRKTDPDAPQPPAAPQPVKRGDPMDWPLPCDVKVGHGTMRKGAPLRTLVARMKVLYEMVTGENADKVAGLTMGERQARMDEFRAALAAAPAGVVGEPVAWSPDLTYPGYSQTRVWANGAPHQRDIDYWRKEGHGITLAYTASPARQALTDAVINAARLAMDESFEVGNEAMDIAITSHLAASLSLSLDEHDRAHGIGGKGGA